MIVLLNCSINLFANESEINTNNPSTGEVIDVGDSVQISYDDLRIVNSKLIELKYEKQINTNLKQIIHNDSIVIKDYKQLNEHINKDCKKAVVQRNVCFGVAIVGIICSIILIVK